MVYFFIKYFKSKIKNCRKVDSKHAKRKSLPTIEEKERNKIQANIDVCEDVCYSSSVEIFVHVRYRNAYNYNLNVNVRWKALTVTQTIDFRVSVQRRSSLLKCNFQI